MASWTDIADLRIQPGQTLASSDDWEGLLDNLELIGHPPAVTVQLDSPQPLPNDTPSAVEWTSAAWQEDRWGLLWESASPSKLVIPVAGKWRFTPSIHIPTISGTGTSVREFSLRVNGNTNRVKRAIIGGRWETSQSWTRRMQQGDDVDIIVNQTSGETGEISETRTLLVAEWCGFAPGAGWTAE